MSFNRKSVLAVCAVATISLVSFQTFAAGASVCSDPLQRICTDTLTQRKERAAFVNNMKKEISVEATAAAAPRIEQMKKEIKPYRIFKRLFSSIRINNQEVMIAAKKRIGGFESSVINDENVSKIKQYMYGAIDGSAFDTATKTKFKDVIKTVVVGNFADFLEKSNLEDSVIAQMLGNACGSDGLIDNAFATTLKGERYVLVCPGLLISLNQEANAEEKFNSILQAISHEMGHHIDNSKVGDELYAPYLNCLAKNYSDSFNKTKEDEKFCKTNAKEPAKCNLKVATSHAGELIADQWGISVTAQHIRAQAYSVVDADKMLTSSWTPLCGSGDEGIHPKGDFRIGTLMRKNPGITSYLGCTAAETDPKPACSFAGETAI